MARWVCDKAEIDEENATLTLRFRDVHGVDRWERTSPFEIWQEHIENGYRFSSFRRSLRDIVKQLLKD